VFLAVGVCAAPMLWLFSAAASTSTQVSQDVCAAMSAHLAGDSEPWLAARFTCPAWQAPSIDVLIEADLMRGNAFIVGTAGRWEPGARW